MQRGDRILRRRSLIEIHLATALFGLAGLFGKWIALSPILIVFGRVAFASLALGAILLATGQSVRRLGRESGWLLLGLGGILATHWVSFFQSIQVSSVAVGLLAYSSFPIFTVFLEPLLTREKIDRVNLVLAGLCLAGVFLIIPRFDPADAIYRGVLWGLLSGLTFAVLTVFNRRLAQKYSSLAIAFGEDLSALLFLFPFIWGTGGRVTGKSLLLLAVLGVVCTAGSHTLFISGMRRVRAQTASIISSLEPVYGILLALFFLGERPSFRTLAGGVIILAAVGLVSVKEAARARAA
jgi:drug/metabolite transporter (DMT)-like permease